VSRVREQLVAGAIPGHKVGKRWLTPLPLLKRWAGVTAPDPDRSEPQPSNVINSPFELRRVS
jgi:hypothetical protein